MILTLHRHPGVPAGWAGPRHARPGWAGTVTSWWRTITTSVPAEPAPVGATEDWHPAAEVAQVDVPAAEVPPLTRHERAAEAAALHDELREMAERWLAPLRQAADDAVRRLLAPLDGDHHLDAIGLGQTAEYRLVAA